MNNHRCSDDPSGPKRREASRRQALFVSRSLNGDIRGARNFRATVRSSFQVERFLYTHTHATGT